MTFVNTLKLVSTAKPINQPPIVTKRAKLVKRLHEQLEMVQARLQGRPHFVTSLRTITNPTTGERRDVEQMRAPKAWFWTGVSGEVLLQIRYGNKPIELKKGNPTIEVKMLTDLLEVIEGLKQAVELGELDQQIEGASASVRSRFAKNKKAPGR